MDEREVRENSLALVESSMIAMVGSLGTAGEPQIKAMMVAEHHGLTEIWFSTNTSSEHVGQLSVDPRACVYFAQWEKEPWRGLMLVGRMEVLRDPASRERLWEDGCERYYPKGVDDPDYTVLRFRGEWAKYYQYGTHLRFDLRTDG